MATTECEMATFVKPKAASTTSSELHSAEKADAGSDASLAVPSAREQSYIQSSPMKVESNIRRALCELVRLAGGRALGALCETDAGGQRLYLFVCTNMSLPASSPEDLCNAILQLTDLRGEKRIPLSCGSVRHVWRAHHFNAAIVELGAEIADTCRKRGANFLQVGTPSLWQGV